MNILRVDDDAELASLLGEFLRREGFTVDSALEGNRGLERALQPGVDLVVLDVMLPGIDGFEILRRLRQKSEVPVLMLTAQSEKDEPGNDWLRTAAVLLPARRVVLDETTRPLYNQTDVIGYASWGSNDDHRTQRLLRFQWLPGAIAAEFVSTSARTFWRPPDTWAPTANWADKSGYFAETPQGLVADLIHEGATGASGNTYEPYLNACVRPDYRLPAYHQGRNLAESHYLSLVYLSWQSVIVGDPLCALKP